jgi:predicted transposase YbfD/YdcC
MKSDAIVQIKTAKSKKEVVQRYDLFVALNMTASITTTSDIKFKKKLTA